MLGMLGIIREFRRHTIRNSHGRKKDDVRQGYKSFIAAVPDYKVEPKSWVTNDTSFAIEVILLGTQKGDFPGLPETRKHFPIRGCALGEFEDGKIKGRRD